MKGTTQILYARETICNANVQQGLNSILFHNSFVLGLGARKTEGILKHWARALSFSVVLGTEGRGSGFP